MGSDDDQENQADAVASAATTTTATSVEEEDRPEFGPHRKLSRGEDLFEFRKEVEMVKEKKFVCSLELFLDLSVGCCRTPGCSKVPKVKHHFMGTTVVVTAKCQAGHIFKFTSSREVIGLYVNNLQSAAVTLLSGNNFGKVSRLSFRSFSLVWVHLLPDAMPVFVSCSGGVVELDAGRVVEGIFTWKGYCGWGWAVWLTWVQCQKGSWPRDTFCKLK